MSNSQKPSTQQKPSTPQKIVVNDVSPKAASKNAEEEYTNDLYQKREKIYQRHLIGLFQRIRHFTMWATLAIYFIGPWLSWNGRQAILFDLPERKFYIFGMTFFPQDFLFLSGMLMIAAFALFFFTVLAGRVWCGYTCPQTVWTTLFMWIEYLTEGDRNSRIRLDAQPKNARKTTRKTLKHSLWLSVSFATGFTFVGYFTPIRELWLDIVYLNLGGWGIFWLVFFTVMTYLNAGWMREQVCFYMCPYARFQSVMFDRDTLIVTYDAARGEPRGSRKKTADPKSEGLGSCINCQLCVQVCPTGIDIRNGLQYECIGCAACIDACDNIMDQMNYPRGLIRYSTENLVEKKPGKIIRARLLGYGSVLAVLVLSFAWLLLNRVPVEFDVLRERTALFRETWDGKIENVYTLKIQNKTQNMHKYSINFDGLKNAKLDVPSDIKATAGELVTVTAVVTADPKDISSPNIRINLKLVANDDQAISVESESRFISPSPKR